MKPPRCRPFVLKPRRPYVRAVVPIFIGVICMLVGCTSKQPSAQHETSAPGNPTAPSDISYLPQNIFGPRAVPGATALEPIDPHSLSETELKFGIAPRRSDTVEYQPGVIVMEHGDKAIRSIAGNGLEWHFDASAPHVSEFEEGKIVFATGRAVGRIISLKKEGDSVTVILGPIQLTDVIRNGKFKLDQAVSADEMISYVAPDFPQPVDDQPQPGAAARRFDPAHPAQVERAVVVSHVDNGVWTPMSASQTYADGRRVAFQRSGDGWQSPGDPSARLMSAVLVQSDQSDHPAMPLEVTQILPGTGLQVPQVPNFTRPPSNPAKTAGTPPVVDVGDLRTLAVANPSYIGIQFYSKKLDGGLGVFAESLLFVNNLHLHFVLDIVNGKILKCGMDMGGALGMKLYMDAHSSKDFQVNLHKKWWEPIDLTIPLGLGNTFGIPFSVTFNMMFNVNSGFSAKQSVIQANGLYTFNGGLWAGYDHGTWSVSQATNLKAQTDLGNTTQGVSLGINSLVVASSVRAMVGIGAFGFNTGVYVGARFVGTILRAADETMPCRQGTVEFYIDSGVGYSLSGFVVDVVNTFLAAFTSYRIDKAGTLLKGPSKLLFHGNTQIPSACATPAQASVRTSPVDGMADRAAAQEAASSAPSVAQRNKDQPLPVSSPFLLSEKRASRGEDPFGQWRENVMRDSKRSMPFALAALASSGVT